MGRRSTRRTPPASGTIRTIRKTADETVNNSNVLQNDDELLFAIAANEIRRARFVLFVANPAAGTGATADFQAAITLPAGASMVGVMQGAGTAATNAGATSGAMRSMTVSGTGKAVGALDADTVIVTIEVVVTCGATAGNVTLQWAQSTATATDTIVKAGSFVQHELVA